MKTRIVMIGNHSTFSDEGEELKEKKQLKNRVSKDYESSETLFESYENLKQILEGFLMEKMNCDRVDLSTFRISFSLKSKKRQKPIPLREESDFIKLVELVHDKGGMLVLKLISKEKKKHQKKHKKEKRKIEDEDSDEDIENKKKQIKLLAGEIEAKKQEMKTLKSELGEMKDLKKSESEITGLMNDVSLDSQPKEKSVPSELANIGETKKEKFAKRQKKEKNKKFANCSK